MLLTYKILYSLEIWGEFNVTYLAPIMVNSGFIVISIVSSMAGLLSDVKWSHYKAVLYSSRVIAIMLLVLSAAIIVFILIVAKHELFKHPKAVRNPVFGAIYFGVFLFSVVYIVFIINAFQFGLDQLHDASTLDSVSYIHWYVWIYHTSSLSLIYP